LDFKNKKNERMWYAVKEIIYDLIISVLIMSLIITVVIPIFDNNISITQTIASKAEDTDKLSGSIADNIPAGGIVTGADIISVIRYFEKENVTITVLLNNGTEKKYLMEKYNPEEFRIPYDHNFLCNYTYGEGKITSVEYTEIAD